MWAEIHASTATGVAVTSTFIAGASFDGGDGLDWLENGNILKLFFSIMPDFAATSFAR